MNLNLGLDATYEIIRNYLNSLPTYENSNIKIYNANVSYRRHILEKILGKNSLTQEEANYLRILISEKKKDIMLCTALEKVLEDN